MRMKICLIVACLCLSVCGAAGADPGTKTANNIKTINRVFQPGEKLTYSISWSKVVEAGIAVMEVKMGNVPDSGPSYIFLSTTRSVGLVESFYPVRDSVESIVVAEELSPVVFHLQESHGKRKRQRTMTFDRAKGSVVFRLNEDPPQTYAVPLRVQDALSSLYYMRTRDDFVVGKKVNVDVFDGGKTWAVEIHVLNKEKITTPAGTFDTIKVKTYPKYEGVFMHKGEIFIWITDDARRIPVLMKSTISIGSIVATLTKMEGVNNP